MITADEDSARVEWPGALHPGEDVISYRVFLDGNAVDPVTDTFYEFEGLTAGLVYSVTVFAFHDDLNSDPLSAEFFTGDGPFWPSGAALSYLPHEATTANLSWPDALVNEGSIDHYVVYKDGLEVGTSPGNEPWLLVGDLQVGTEYDFSVVAVGDQDESAALLLTVVHQARPTWPEDPQLTVSDVTATSAKLTWPEANDDDENLVFYQIEWCQVDGDDLDCLTTTVDEDQTEFDLTDLAPGFIYQVLVSAVDDDGNYSLTALDAQFFTADPLEWPVGAQVHYSQATATTGTVSWTAAVGGSGAITYTVTVNGLAVGTATHPQTSLEITGLVGGQTYEFSVFASDSLGAELEPLDPIERTQAAFPQWSGSAQFKVSGISQTTATVSWSGALPGSAPIALYQLSLERETSPGSNTWGPLPDIFAGGAVASQLLTGLDAGVRYRVAVTAFNDDGWASPPSPLVPFTTRVPGSSGIAAGDEIMFYRNDGTYRVYETLANGSLGATLFSGQIFEDPWTSVTKLDLDGDGKDEVLFYRANGTYKYQRMNADGTLGTVMRQGSDYTKNWTSITAVDLDGDGIDELMFYRADGLFRFYRVRPDATVGSPLAAGSNFTKNWTSIDSVDLNGDARDELFFYRADGLYRFYRPRPDGSLPQPMAQGDDYTKNWTSISGVDVNGDGRDEMVFYRADGLYRVYRPRPDGSLPSPIQAGSNFETGWTSITGVNADAK